MTRKDAKANVSPCSLDKVEAREELVVEPTHHLLNATRHPSAQAARVPHLGGIVLDVICAVGETDRGS